MNTALYSEIVSCKHKIYKQTYLTYFNAINLFSAKDDCKLAPRCQNGGTCIDRENSYQCNCMFGFKGLHCECEYYLSH